MIFFIAEFGKAAKIRKIAVYRFSISLLDQSSRGLKKRSFRSKVVKSSVTIFTFFILTDFKTDRYLNNFKELLFGVLRLRKYETRFKISFPRENKAVKHDLVEFKVECLKVFCYHGNKCTILLFYSIFRTTPEVSTKLHFVEIS